MERRLSCRRKGGVGGDGVPTIRFRSLRSSATESAHNIKYWGTRSPPSYRRRSLSTTSMKTNAKAIRNVATARIAGLISSRIPDHI